MAFENKRSEFKVKYFTLRDDGDEAIVRFNYSEPSEFEAAVVHTVKDGNFYRKVACIDTDVVPCPFCDNNIQIGTRFFVRMIQYVTSDSGNIETQAVIWDRPASFARTLKSFIDEYGNLRNMIFKIKRSGARGDMATTYSIIPANAAVYKDEIYKPDFSDFSDFSLVNKFYFEKTADEMITYIKTGQFPQRQSTSQSFNGGYVRGSARTNPFDLPVRPSMPNIVNDIIESDDLGDTFKMDSPQQVTLAQPTNNATRPRRYTF